MKNGVLYAGLNAEIFIIMHTNLSVCLFVRLLVFFARPTKRPHTRPLGHRIVVRLSDCTRGTYFYVGVSKSESDAATHFFHFASRY